MQKFRVCLTYIRNSEENIKPTELLLTLNEAFKEPVSPEVEIVEVSVIEFK